VPFVAAERTHVLLISCLGEQTGGGLFAFDGDTLEQLETLSTTGLALAGGRLGRLLWSSGETGSVGELLIYDEAGVERYVRIDSLREPHDLAWAGRSSSPSPRLRTASSGCPRPARSPARGGPRATATPGT